MRQNTGVLSCPVESGHRDASLAASGCRRSPRRPIIGSWMQDSRLRCVGQRGAGEQARVLVDRLPAAGHFDVFQQVAGHEVRYRFGREADGSPAPSWGWDDLD